MLTAMDPYRKRGGKNDLWSQGLLLQQERAEV
jgi:hypothetical protein